MTSPISLDLTLFERILRTVASATAIKQLGQEHSYKARGGIYNVAVLIWLMIYQRLNGKGTLSSAVQFLARQAISWQTGPHIGKRVREGRISLATGGYCQARLKMPTLVANSVCKHIFEQLQVVRREQLPEAGRPVFLIDGTTLRLPHSRELVKAFPPGRNQHGDNHWPTMLMVTFHDAHTGLATQPSWGPMYGKRAIGEQSLASQALQKLPADAIVMADINFGIFAFAYAVQQTQRPMLFRLNAMRAGKVLRGQNLRPGRRRRVEWEASARDHKTHPGLPEGAVVKGWVVACRHPDGNGEMLYFFTTLDLKPKRIVALYKLRWNIGVSRQGHIVQSVKDRPRSKDSGLVAGEASWRESKTAEPSDNMLRKECAQRTRLQRAVNVEVASLHEIPVAETVDNARKQQGLAETSPMRQLSPAGYQRRHGVKDDVETGEALGARRRNLAEEMLAITSSGKCRHRHQGGGSGRSTEDGRAAKRARREGPGPVSNPSVKARQG